MMGLKRLKALGTMSGTSLDGVDAAVIETDGVEIFGFGAHAFRPYSEGERAVLSAALGHWPGTPEVVAATEVMERAHIELLSGFEGVDVIGFHGQTFAHDPRGRGTHQAGSGARLAQALGRDVVWDFRSEDVARGGQGAPLAPFYHVALAKWAGARAPVAFLNLGGVGNLTWLDPAKASPEEAGACLAFDTGPANAPINDLMQARLGRAFDEGGALAREGKVDAAILADFLAHPYFAKRPPKSLDRDDFKGVLAAVEPLSEADAIATLTAAAAQAVVAGAAFFPSAVSTLWVTGGGRHNGFLMDQLAQSLGCKVAPVEAAGMNGDMLEAQAFGYLAVRVLNGLPNSAPSTTGVPEPVVGGQISSAFGAA